MELIKIKYVNPTVKVIKHHVNCYFDHYKKELRGCTCIEKQYTNAYNFKLKTKTFEVLKTNNKKYSLLCKVDNELYYCYNLNEILDAGFTPINVRFENGCFLWEIEGVVGKYKSGAYFKTKL